MQEGRTLNRPPAHWIHVPTPRDHYSPRTGSALMTIVHELSRCHERAGGVSRVLVSEGTYSEHYPHGRVSLVSAGPTAGKAKRLWDAAAGRLGGSRRFTCSAYRPMLDAIPMDFEGVVLIQNAPAVMPSLLVRCPKAVRVLYLHNDVFRTYTHREAESVLSSCDAVVCVSDFLRRVTAAKAPRAAAAGRLHAVLSGVDPKAFSPRAQRASRQVCNGQAAGVPRMLFVGRVVPAKGPDLLIRAAVSLRERGVRCRVRIVGSAGFTAAAPLSAYEKELRALATPLGGDAEFVPFVERAGLVEQYHAADVFCVPSVWDEPLGLIVLEAMACGLPVVASNRGGIPEAGGGVALYFDPTEGPSVLASRLFEILNDQSRRRAMQIAGLERAREMSWETTYQRLCRLSQVSNQAKQARVGAA